MYALFATGLLLLGQRRSATPGPRGLDETAVLTIGMGLLAWVFLIQPTWTDDQEPLVTRLVGMAYPFYDMVLFAMLMQLTTSARPRTPAFLLVGSLVGALLVADGVFAAGAFVAAIGARTYLLDFGWLLS